MSFKREGDDQALLHNLKMRRVGELLGDHIPEDEAKLLSNGRLTCLICNHRPIFDTMAMLANHRKGKKHISELGKYLLHKRELEYNKLKSDQKQFLQVETIKKASVQFKNKDFSRKIILDVRPQTSEYICRDKTCSVEIVPSSKPSASSVVRHYLKGIQRRRALQKTVERCRENYNSLTQSSSSAATPLSETSLDANKTLQEKYAKSDDGLKRDLKLRMAGWIKSPDGKWMKDPNVEFDSDEELPEI